MGVLTFSGRSQIGDLGSNCWTHLDAEGNGGVTRCADFVEPVPSNDPVPVPAGAPIRMDSDAKSVHGALHVMDGDGGELEMRKSLNDLRSATVDVPPGEYLLEVSASWPQGSALIYFSIQVT
jgi:hypothetical protein